MKLRVDEHGDLGANEVQVSKRKPIESPVNSSVDLVRELVDTEVAEKLHHQSYYNVIGLGGINVEIVPSNKNTFIEASCNIANLGTSVGSLRQDTVSSCQKSSASPCRSSEMKMPRRSRAEFSEKLKDLLSSPDYGDGFGSKLRNRNRKQNVKRKKSLEIQPAVSQFYSFPLSMCYTGGFCQATHPCMQCGCSDFMYKSHETIFHTPPSSAAQTELFCVKDMACTLGISMESLRHDKVIGRRKNIQEKLKLQAMPDFTVEEEFDIHCRAEVFAGHIIPDADYHISGALLPNSISNEAIPPCKSDSGQRITEAGSLGVDPQTPRKRRRQLSVMEGFISFCPPPNGTGCHDLSASCVTLADGTKLLKPPLKLVELVAKAISDSPDGLLQVQQVYNVLHSIRHALYQKWFLKIQFTTELINTRGCYWAINRRHHPKEWSLPPDRHTLSEDVYDEAASDSGVISAHEAFLLSNAAGDLAKETLWDDANTVCEDPSLNLPLLDLADFDRKEPLSDSAHDVSLASFFEQGPSAGSQGRDPDPMFHSLQQHDYTHEMAVLDEEALLSSASSVQSSNSSPSLTEPTQDISDWLKEASIASSSYYGEINSWIPSFDDSVSPSQRVPRSQGKQNSTGSEVTSPLTYMAAVPPDIQQLHPYELEVCMQQILPYDEHW